MNYCSPVSQHLYATNKSCFDRATLVRIVEAYNRKYVLNPIDTAELKGKQVPFILNKLRVAMEGVCDNNEGELCWISHLGLDYDTQINNSVRPKTPHQWIENPTTWLDNFNIEAVLIQYQYHYRHMYKFLGVLPSDFLSRPTISNDLCYYKDICTIEIAKLLRQNIKCIGMVINLDKHDENGSHWTSMFACIDPVMSSFGAYYYDSTTRPPPQDMFVFMENLKTQAMPLQIGKNAFKIETNKVRHQYSRTECGMFAVYNQIRWLEELSKERPKSFQKLCNEKKITDDNMIKLRKKLFRPI